MDNKAQIFNLINDPNVNFFLIATPQLKKLIISGGHPLLAKLNKRVKAEFLADKAFVIDREDVYNFVMNNGKLNAEQSFLLSQGEIRVVGEPSIKLDKGNK